MLEIKSPYLNSVMEPDRFVTLTDMFSKLPAGKKKPTIGSIISVTNEVTSLDVPHLLQMRLLIQLFQIL